MSFRSSNAEIEQIVRAGPIEDAGGWALRRALPAGRRRAVGPFLRFERFGHDGATRVGCGAHPHAGLAELSYVLEGGVLHRDSLGHAQPIVAGEAGLLQAGRGVVHEERAAGPTAGVRAWLALPPGGEEEAPRFRHLCASALPRLDGDGIRATLVAGSLHGRHAPLECGEDLVLALLALEEGLRFRVDAEHEERALYVLEGAVELGGHWPAGADRLVVFRPGGEIVLRALGAARLMLLGGRKLAERRHCSPNFVSCRRERLDQATRDWQAGRFPTLPGAETATPSGGGAV